MTDVKTTCRDLNELTPAAQTACRLLFQECFKAGIVNIFITETYRSQERQNYLYAQGRTRPGKKVTWTLQSNHKSRRAWDIATAGPDLYDKNVLSKVGEIAKKLGIVWGGTWIKNMDKPHFEVPQNWKVPKGYKLEGEVIVPSNSKLKVQLIVKDKDGGLTMDQYNELRKLIDAQDKKIVALEKELASKADYESTNSVGKSHKEALEWAIEEGIIKGDGKGSYNPKGVLTREQMATMLHRYHSKYVNKL